MGGRGTPWVVVSPSAGSDRRATPQGGVRSDRGPEGVLGARLSLTAMVTGPGGALSYCFHYVFDSVLEGGTF